MLKEITRKIENLQLQSINKNQFAVKKKKKALYPKTPTELFDRKVTRRKIKINTIVKPLVLARSVQNPKLTYTTQDSN